MFVDILPGINCDGYTVDISLPEDGHINMPLIPMECVRTSKIVSPKARIKQGNCSTRSFRHALIILCHHFCV